MLIGLLSLLERIHAPPVVKPMKNVTAIQGANATLLCEAVSDSRPHFQFLRWFQSSPSNGSDNSTEIRNSQYSDYEVIKTKEQDSHLVKFLGDNKEFDFLSVKLVLVNVTKKDEGKYSCIVGNAVGYSVEQAYVFVNEEIGRT